MLDTGCIRQHFRSENFPPSVLQVTDLHKVKNTALRCNLSDGELFMKGVLASQLKPLYDNGQIKETSIIRVTQAIVNFIKGKHLLCVLGCDVIQTSATIVGNPKDLDDEEKSIPPPMPIPSSFQNPFEHKRRSPEPANESLPAPSPRKRSRPNPISGDVKDDSKLSPNRPEVFQKVKNLNPYQSQNFSIKVRVQKKGQIRHWSNARGDGKVANIDLMDEDGTEIRCCMFNDQCDRLYNTFPTGEVVILRGGKIKTVTERGKQFTHIPNDYEIELNRFSNVELCHGENSFQAFPKFNFIAITDIMACEANNYIDVLGYVSGVQALTEVVSRKNQTTMKKRDITLIDKCATVELTLWRDNAEKWTEGKLLHHVAAFKACKVSDWNGGRNLSGANEVYVDPDLPEAMDLKTYWDSKEQADGGGFIPDAGGAAPSTPGPYQLTQVSQVTLTPSEFIPICEVVNKGNDEKIETFNCRGTLGDIRFNEDRAPWYFACPDPNEKFYKVEKNEDGKYFCEKTGKSYDTCVVRWRIRAAIMDNSGKIYADIWNDVGNQIMGLEAKSAHQLQSEEKFEELEKIFAAASWKTYNFRLSARTRSWNGETKHTVQVKAAKSFQWRQEAADLYQAAQTQGIELFEEEYEM